MFRLVALHIATYSCDGQSEILVEYETRTRITNNKTCVISGSKMYNRSMRILKFTVSTKMSVKTAILSQEDFTYSGWYSAASFSSFGFKQTHFLHQVAILKKETPQTYPLSLSLYQPTQITLSFAFPLRIGARSDCIWNKSAFTLPELHTISMHITSLKLWSMYDSLQRQRYIFNTHQGVKATSQ